MLFSKRQKEAGDSSGTSDVCHWLREYASPPPRDRRRKLQCQKKAGETLALREGQLSLSLDPRLVRVQVGLDDRPQLVVVTLKLLRVHQQMVSQFLWGHTQHHADFHVIIQL